MRGVEAAILAICIVFVVLMAVVLMTIVPRGKQPTPIMSPTTVTMQQVAAPPTVPASRFSAVDHEVLQSAVLLKLEPMLGFGLGYQPDAAKIARQRAAIKCVDEWVRSTVHDPLLRDAYAGWLKFYTDEADRAEHDLRERADPVESAHDIAKRAAVNELAHELPAPEVCRYRMPAVSYGNTCVGQDCKR